MFRRLEQISGQRKNLIVSGCLAAVEAEEVVKRAPDAMIIPPKDYSSFGLLVKEAFGVGDLTERPTLPGEITATLPISQGCLGACSYCITKKARGVLTSYALQDIISNARSAIENGAKEVLVTSQDTACYGFDSGRTLADVLNGVTSIPGDFMVRVGMMNPDSLSKMIEEFIPAFAGPKIYQFVHLPIQSGSERVLEGMNRGYKIGEYRNLIDKIRTESPSLTLSTDVIDRFSGGNGR